MKKLLLVFLILVSSLILRAQEQNYADINTRTKSARLSTLQQIPNLPVIQMATANSVLSNNESLINILATAGVGTPAINSTAICTLDADCSNIVDMTIACRTDLPPVDFNLPIVIDSCGDISLSALTIIPGDTGCPGDTLTVPRTYFIQDAVGNMTQCKQTFTIISEAGPTFTTFPADTSILYGNSTDPSVTGMPTGAGECDSRYQKATISNTDVSASDSLTITRTWFVTDKCGRVTSRDQIINIIDTTSPTALCNDTTLYLGAEGNVSVTAAGLDDGSSDASGIATLAINSSSFDCANVGSPISVTLTVTDNNTNTSTCTSIVTVLDTTKPSITCPADIFAFADSDLCNIALTIASPATADNCGVNSVINDFNNTNNASGTYPIGTTIVKWLVTDPSGNKDSCYQTIYSTAAPSAINDFVAVAEDNSLNFNPLDNDFDCEGRIDITSLTILDSTKSAPLVLTQSTGHISYSPPSNYFGADTFRYAVSDLDGYSDTAMVYITVTPVNDAPVANNDNLIAFENISSVVDVLANDSDIDMDNLRVFVTKPPSSGGSAYVSSNKITYRSPKGFSGEDVFEYQVCDYGLAPIKCATAKVYVTVNGINDLVVVDHEFIVVDEDATFTGDLTDVGDYDPDGTELLASTTLVSPLNGTLVVAADGMYSYTPNANFYGTDLAVVRVCDQGLPLPATCIPDSIYITVVSVNDAPVATLKSVITEEDAAPITIDISAHVSDIENNGLATTIISGSATFSSIFELSYSPALNFNGADVVTYAVCDDLGACDTGVVNITVTPVNDPPILEITIDNVEIDLFSSETIPLVGAFTDVDAGDVLTVEVTMVGGSPLPAWVVYNPTTTTLVCSPSDASHIGIYNLKATATDGAGAQESTTFSVTVQQANTLSGYIYLGDKGGAKSGLITKGGQAGDPAVDVLLVLSHNGVFVDSTRTNNEGYYIFYNLAPLMYDMEVYFENLEAEFEIQITSASDAPVAEGYNFTVWPESAIITDVNIPGQSFEINMYPNPSKGNVILEMGNTGNSGTTVSVYNIAGQKIFGDQFSENRILLNLKNQVSGMYYVKVTTDSSEVIKKLVLSKE